MSDAEINDTVHPKARAFGSVAGEYERARPDYPTDAVAHLVDVLGLGPGKVLADIGAGTGKLTRLLVPSGAEIHAVEPVDGMREELLRRVPGVTAHPDSAESLPFADAGLDAATVAQAVHWFGPGWVDEIARTLRPGAAVAIVYNLRDRTQELNRAISDARERVAEGAPSYASGRWRAPLDATTALRHDGFTGFRWSYERTHAEVLDQVLSLAPISALAPTEQQEILAEIAAVLAAEADPVALRCTTEVTLYRRH